MLKNINSNLWNLYFEHILNVLFYELVLYVSRLCLLEQLFLFNFIFVFTIFNLFYYFLLKLTSNYLAEIFRKYHEVLRVENKNVL